MSDVAVLTKKRATSAQPHVKLVAPPSPPTSPVVAFHEVKFSLGHLLDDSPHPTFVLDRANYTTSAPRTLPLVFYNTALKSSPFLFKAILPGTGSGDPFTLPRRLTSHKTFMEWIFRSKDDSNIGKQPYLFHDQLWTAYTARSRWLIVQAISFDAAQYGSNGGKTAHIPSCIRPESSRRGSTDSIQSVSHVSRLLGSQLAGIVAAEYEHVKALEFDDDLVETANEFIFDKQWQNYLPNRYSPHVELVCGRDWAKSPLGPMERWSLELRLMCVFVLTAEEPMVVFWSDAYVPIYNEAYVPMLGEKHPNFLGSNPAHMLHEVWHTFSSIFRRGKEKQIGQRIDNKRMVLMRSGFLEECYFTAHWVPCLGRNRKVLGWCQPVAETTTEVMRERFTRTLLSLDSSISNSKTMKEGWGQVLKVLQVNAADSPFAMMYTESTTATSDMSGSRHFDLVGSFGLRGSHPTAVTNDDLYSSMAGFFPKMRQSLKVVSPLILYSHDLSLNADLMQDLQQRGFPDHQCRAVAICPIRDTRHSNEGYARAFLILGLNPRRPVDDHYRLYLQVLNHQLDLTMYSERNFQDNTLQQDVLQPGSLRDELVKQLQCSTRETVNVEMDIRNFGKHAADIGVAVGTADGHYTYRNDCWFAITRQDVQVDSMFSWAKFVHPSHVELARDAWERVRGGDARAVELMVNAQWRIPSDLPDHIKDEVEPNVTWVMMYTKVQQASDGTVQSWVSMVIDISRLKWFEKAQTRQLDEALAARKAQDEFIDMTSHELRNPIGAILLSADQISATLARFRALATDEQSLATIDDTIEAAETIMACSSSMQRIINDVLVMSKMGAGLLEISPAPASPNKVMKHCISLFAGEMRVALIQNKLKLDPSLDLLNIDRLYFDESRVVQIVVNLLSNAIKFTRARPKKSITLTLGASKERPTQWNGVKYMPPSANRADVTLDEEWGTGEQLYLLVSVQDSGIGLLPEEKDKLFKRFMQASVKTHTQYGGSGLGLSISRDISELMCGSIGLDSVSGEGSTFSFFVKVRRAPSFPKEDRRPASLFPPATIPTSPTAIATRPASAGLLATTPATAPLAIKGATSNRVIKVLLVEDNLLNAKVFSKQLKSFGCEVTHANQGAEALAAIEKTKFWHGREADGEDLSVVLMDQEMPVMDGLTCVRKIRELQESGQIIGHVPVIGVTANARPQQMQILMDAGMDDIVTKPFRAADLMARVVKMAMTSTTSSPVGSLPSP